MWDSKGLTTCLKGADGQSDVVEESEGESVIVCWNGGDGELSYW